MRTAAVLPAPSAAGPLSPIDEAMLDGLQRAAFGYFVQNVNCSNGLTVLRFLRDSDPSGAPDSVGHKSFYFHFLYIDTATRAIRPGNRTAPRPRAIRRRRRGRCRRHTGCACAKHSSPPARARCCPTSKAWPARSTLAAMVADAA